MDALGTAFVAAERGLVARPRQAESARVVYLFLEHLGGVAIRGCRRALVVLPGNQPRRESPPRSLAEAATSAEFLRFLLESRAASDVRRCSQLHMALAFTLVRVTSTGAIQLPFCE